MYKFCAMNACWLESQLFNIPLPRYIEKLNKEMEQKDLKRKWALFRYYKRLGYLII